MHTYRSKGVEKLLTTKSGDKIRSICFVKPLMIKNVEDQKDKNFDEKVLSGFIVEIEILRNKAQNS